jgi:aarF domain-containing kinase
MTLNYSVLQVRVFLVSAKYCTRAVWEDDRMHLIDTIRKRGLLSVSIFQYFGSWL